jgi:hypothetical protein
MAQVFCSCDVSYLAKSLSKIKDSVLDQDKLEKRAMKAVQKMRRTKELTSQEARDMLAQIENGLEVPMTEGVLLSRLFGEDWWDQLPMKANPRYLYLCRIIQAVQQALKVPATSLSSPEAHPTLACEATTERPNDNG